MKLNPNPRLGTMTETKRNRTNGGQLILYPMFLFGPSLNSMSLLWAHGLTLRLEKFIIFRFFLK